MGNRYTDQHPQFLDSNGDPLADGSVEYFTEGNTGDSNRKNTFSDQALSVPNQNPLPLDGSGRTVTAVFLSGSYNTVIRNSNGVQIDQVDSVSGDASSQGVSTQTVALVSAIAAIDTDDFQSVYAIGTTVIGDGGQGRFYFKPTSTETANGVNVIAPDNGNGRWLLQNNSHNSVRVAVAAGTTDTITIDPEPNITDLDSEVLFLVQSLGANTIQGVTFKAGDSATLNLKRNAGGGSLAIGDCPPVGGIMIIKLADDESEYYLANPFKVNTERLNDEAVTTPKIADLNVTTAKIANMGVTTAKIDDLGVIRGKLALLAVDTAQLEDLSVSNDKLGNSSVGTNKLGTNAVTTDKILNLNVTTGKIDNDAVTYGKIQNVANDQRLLGNVSGAGSIVEELTLQQILTFLGMSGTVAAEAINIVIPITSSVSLRVISNKETILATSTNHFFTYATSFSALPVLITQGIDSTLAGIPDGIITPVNSNAGNGGGLTTAGFAVKYSVAPSVGYDFYYIAIGLA